ncbi:MAG TPA: GTPase, partial [Acidimicrobiales bacterium]|nr:GTPase [Acidimicrobiales bacterium]
MTTPAPLLSTRQRPLVVIAGRPNVGKSTLVNRIVGRRAAVVEERAGVTRDRKELDAEWCGHAFTVVDTGGWLSSADPLDAQVSAQAERAIAEADVVLLVVDVTVGLTDEDLAVARFLRRSGRPIRVVVNKVDSSQRETDAWEAVSLGLGDPFPVSALHGRGTGDLLDDVVSLLPDPRTEGAVDEGAPSGEDEPDGAEVEPLMPRVAIIGRPNVGKSTLFNRLVGDERSV